MKVYWFTGNLLMFGDEEHITLYLAQGYHWRRLTKLASIQSGAC